MLRVALGLSCFLLMNGGAFAEMVRIPLSAIEMEWGQQQCDVAIKDEARHGDELAAGLRLVMIPCTRAAYNFGWLVFAVDPKAPEHARLLRLPDWTRKGVKATSVVVTPDYDEKTRTLTSVQKGRGVGDCGTISTWKWSGTDFNLVSVLHKEKCDGQPFDDDKRWQVYPRRR